MPNQFTAVVERDRAWYIAYCTEPLILASRLVRPGLHSSVTIQMKTYPTANGMRDTFIKLDMELRIWQEWAEAASREENGWEVDAPNWTSVSKCAEELLLEPDLRAEELSEIETVFCLSVEDEHMADFLKANYPKVPRETIIALSKSAKPDVRWQLYDSLLNPDEFSRCLLLQAFDDSDDYVRRRAFLRLLATQTLPQVILERAANDSDAVVREKAQTYTLTDPQTT